jgi:hypothetical protein
MMIRLIFDEAADACVRDIITLAKVDNVGTVVRDALVSYRGLLQSQSKLEAMADELDAICHDTSTIGVKEVIYESEP